MHDIVWRSVEATRLAGEKYDFNSAELQRDIEQLAKIMEALRMARRRQHWPNYLLRELHYRQRGLCGCGCGHTLPDLAQKGMHVDHSIVPWSLGGGNSWSNLKLLLAQCNLKKGVKCGIDDVILAFRDQLLNLAPLHVIAAARNAGKLMQV